MKKLLIANRGEIAIRIMRACRDLGISPVAIYSALDHDALHVRMADYAFPIDDYLNAAGIVALAQRESIDAIHPGYGFLAENDDFARQVQDAGMTWVGPAPDIIAQLGSKIAARQLAQDAGVPILPGTIDPVDTLDAARAAADDIGFPIMLKAVAGGGGKGMRIINSADEFASAFELARGEAVSAFGDGAVYLERYVPAPHHIEVQILADHHGAVLHCFERECSVQRRHQKLIEEAPSPFISADTRERICEAAVALTAQAKYNSVGTVEFLVDAQQNFYFLEVNTRIQVEHPITELITGIDLVAQQIEVAFGKALALQQSDITIHGHALECRICAENPYQQFMPAPGTITTCRAPQGPHVRFDACAETGTTIHNNYDPMIGKLCTWGDTRGTAITRMQRALQETRIAGLTTNMAFHSAALACPAFLDGEYDTQFIAQHHDTLCIAPELSPQHNVDAAIAATLQQHLKTHSQQATKLSPWHGSARQQGVQHED